MLRHWKAGRFLKNHRIGKLISEGIQAINNRPRPHLHPHLRHQQLE